MRRFFDERWIIPSTGVGFTNSVAGSNYDCAGNVVIIKTGDVDDQRPASQVTGTWRGTGVDGSIRLNGGRRGHRRQTAARSSTVRRTVPRGGR